MTRPYFTPDGPPHGMARQAKLPTPGAVPLNRSWPVETDMKRDDALGELRKAFDKLQAIRATHMKRGLGDAFEAWTGLCERYVRGLLANPSAATEMDTLKADRETYRDWAFAAEAKCASLQAELERRKSPLPDDPLWKIAELNNTRERLQASLDAARKALDYIATARTIWNGGVRPHKPEALHDFIAELQDHARAALSDPGLKESTP